VIDETGLPLPLGANAIRRSLGPERIGRVNDLLKGRAMILANVIFGAARRIERDSSRISPKAIYRRSNTRVSFALISHDLHPLEHRGA